jgi:hypothetical protein
MQLGGPARSSGVGGAGGPAPQIERGALDRGRGDASPAAWAPGTGALALGGRSTARPGRLPSAQDSG